MKRTIVGFRQDEDGDWVADLDCGHGQHMRHRPPFINRPRVVAQAGRDALLGAALDCVRCDRMEWPERCVAFRRTPEFDETTLPSGFLRDHATKCGVWARLRVASGALRYCVGPPVGRSFHVDPASSAIIVPELRHRVEPQGAVRFFIEFFRVEAAPDGNAAASN